MSTCVRVEEIDGPYGPFAIGERAIQRLWASGEVRGPMAATSGATIEIVHPGDWNRGAGPDFLGAKILVDGKRLRGDIEIHLRCADWNAHGHDRDPHFGGVILHAVLLPGTKDVATLAGHRPETVVLYPTCRATSKTWPKRTRSSNSAAARAKSRNASSRRNRIFR